MMPQLHNALKPYSVPVYSCSGFGSLTARHELTKWCHDTYVYHGKEPIVFHLGDYDSDGDSIFDSLVEVVMGFLRKDEPSVSRIAIFKRVALMLNQVEKYGLPTAPPKKTSSRTKNWSGRTTCQLEALPPDVLLREVVRWAEMFIDQEVFEEARDKEVTARRNIVGALPSAGGGA